MRLEKRVNLKTGESKIKHVRERWEDWLYFRVTADFLRNELPLAPGYFKTHYDRLTQVYEYWAWYGWPIGKLISLFK